MFNILAVAKVRSGMQLQNDKPIVILTLFYSL
jgi:hypothetical protein